MFGVDGVDLPLEAVPFEVVYQGEADGALSGLAPTTATVFGLKNFWRICLSMLLPTPQRLSRDQAAADQEQDQFFQTGVENLARGAGRDHQGGIRLDIHRFSIHHHATGSLQG